MAWHLPVKNLRDSSEGKTVMKYISIAYAKKCILNIQEPEKKKTSITKWKLLSHFWLFAIPWNSPGQNTGVGSLALLQGMFPTQGSNPGLPHCRQILYQLSHKGSQRILEWVAYPFSSRSSWPRNQTRVLHCRQILYQLSYQRSPAS